MLIILSIIISGIIIYSATGSIVAQELMPYDLIGENDTFNIVLDVNNSGYISALTYSYEYAD